MAVTLNNTKDIDGTKQWINITLTVDGDTVAYTSVQPWNTNTPVLTGSDLQAFCNNREATYQVEILKGMYPNARYQDNEGDTELAKFTAWIAAGHTNAEYTKGDEVTIPEEVITKVPFVNSHAYTGDMRTRKLEELNQDLQTYLYTKYDVGTQISFQAIDSRADTPQVVKDSMTALFAWISGVMNHYYAIKKAIRDNADWESVTWNFATSFDATDPDVSLEALMG